MGNFMFVRLLVLAAVVGVVVSFGHRQGSLRLKSSYRGVAHFRTRVALGAAKSSTPVETSDSHNVMRPRIRTPWESIRAQLHGSFHLTEPQLKKYDEVNKEDLLKAYEMMQLSRLFENACNQAYMQGHIRGFMHLDNGQESIPAMIADTIRQGDIKHSYYREHTHALASNVSPNKIMAE
eukprot:gene18669-21861_t